MRRKLALAGAVLLALFAFGGLGVSRGPERVAADPGPPIQDFDLDVVICLAANPGNNPDPTIDPPGFPKGACGVENTLLGAAVTESNAIFLGNGDRIGLPYIYRGPGWQISPDAAIPDGTQTGDVKSQIDLGCDGITDIVADSTNPNPPPNITLAGAIPEPYVEQTTAWDLIPNEAFLTTTLPGPSMGARLVRYHADIDTLFLAGGMVRYSPPSPTPLNLPVMTLAFGPGTHISTTTLGGNPSAPSTSLLCLQAGQQSVSNTYGMSGAVQVRANPAPSGILGADGIDDASGIYAMWVTEASNPDVVSTDVSFALVTNCKTVTDGLPQVHLDADNDCAEDPGPNLQPGRPVDPAPGVPDADFDGLPDGVELAWGSNPLMADTDLDGRTDLEEMVGPTQFLSNPLVPDTDGDGFVDAGLRVDCNKDGMPDNILYGGPNIAGGRYRITVQVCRVPGPVGSVDEQNKTPFGPRGARLEGNTKTGFPLAAAVGDNCPSLPNPGQENLSLLPLAKDRLAANDVTNPDKSWYGDACNTDRDGDAINDAAEARFVFYPASATHGAECHMDGDSSDAGGATPDGFWTVPAVGYPDPGTNYAVTPLTVETLVGGVRAAVPDSDYDGTLDGIECEQFNKPTGMPPGSSNPLVKTVKPSPCSSFADADGDSDTLCNGPGSPSESWYRTQGIMTSGGLNNNPDGDAKLTGDSDSDSDNDNLADGIEAKGWIGGSGPGASSTDSDSDGCIDYVQVGSINNDRQNALADAVSVVKAANGLAPTTAPLHPQEIHITDVNRDGAVALSDAVMIVKLPATSCDIFW